MVKILLDSGANPNFAGKSGKLPLYVAAKNQKPGNLEIMELLIAKGADVNCKHVNGWRAFLNFFTFNMELLYYNMYITNTLIQMFVYICFLLVSLSHHW